MNSQITKTKSAIIVRDINPNPYKPEISQAEIEQTVTTMYPSKRVGNSASDILFGLDEYNLAPGQTFDSKRVTWIDVPNGKTVEEVAAMLATKPNACIYRKISNNVMDVLTDEQKSAIERDVRSMEDTMSSRLVRDAQGNELEGTPQYAQNFFSLETKADVDTRTSVNIATPAIHAESDMSIAA